MVTVTKKDLVALGYGNSFATDIIRLAKIRMVEKGYPFYSSRKLDRVPAERSLRTPTCLGIRHR